MYKYLLFLTIILGSCCNRKTTVQSYSVVKVWKEKNTSELTKISPKFIALLSNNDTVSCTTNTRIGDVIVYKYITK